MITCLKKEIMSENIKSFIIEGNIGAGKSTFLRLIKEVLSVEIVPEPVEEWQAGASGQNLLNFFYKDTKRWAYTFQSYAFLTRIMAQKKNALLLPHGGIQILERSVYSDRYCFAKNCFEMGTLTSLEWGLYKECFDWLVLNFSYKPSGFIYLRTTPEKCFDRLKKRNRSEESCVSLDYLKKLHEKHENWLIEKQDCAYYLKDIPILVLEVDSEFEKNKSFMNELQEKIVNFMALHKNVAQEKNSFFSLRV